jgi:hypothetical protein
LVTIARKFLGAIAISISRLSVAPRAKLAPPIERGRITVAPPINSGRIAP